MNASLATPVEESPSQESPSGLAGWINRGAMYVALLAAWVAMLGSLYFSLVSGFVPCDLCWYQRILMYPLSVLIAAGLTLRDRHLPKLVLPFSLLGMGIATYHYLLEKTDWFDGVQVCRNGVACTTMWINWAGFITIPFLSLTAFTIITIAAFIALRAGEPDEERAPLFGSRAWVPVAAVVIPVLLIYGVSFSNGWARTQEARDLAEQMELGMAGVTGAMTAATDLGAEPPAGGEALFREACAACHGLNAEGVPNLGNTLVASEFIRGLNDTELLQYIREGRDLNSPENTTGLVMPPSGGRPD
ncbi:MAG: disulfide oxidoreductase, partial [Caldilineaceae bacterium]